MKVFPIFFLDLRVHFPHPPSPSNGMGVDFLICLDLEGRMLRRKFLVDWSSPPIPPALLLPPPLNTLAANERPAAKKKATSAVLNTSDNTTATKDGQRVDGVDVR